MILTLAVLSVFRWIEMRVPTQAYYYFEMRYEREGNLSEEGMRELLKRLGFSIANFSYRLDGSGDRSHAAAQHDAADHGSRRGPRLARWLEENTDRARVPAVTHRATDSRAIHADTGDGLFVRHSGAPSRGSIAA